MDRGAGAIEQEVARDLSNPTTNSSPGSTRISSPERRTRTTRWHQGFLRCNHRRHAEKFYRDWYAPNNAILVIAGDVDPAATLAKSAIVRAHRAKAASGAAADPVPPVKADSFTLDSNLPMNWYLWPSACPARPVRTTPRSGFWAMSSPASAPACTACASGKPWERTLAWPKPIREQVWLCHGGSAPGTDPPHHGE